MNIVEKMSRTNYEVFVSLIVNSNKVDNYWSIGIDEDNYPKTIELSTIYY